MTHLKSRKGYDHPNNGATHMGIFKVNSEGRRRAEERACFWANRVRRITRVKKEGNKNGRSVGIEDEF